MFLSFSLPLRFARAVPLPLVPFLRSSGASSCSSCLLRLLLFELLDGGGGGLGTFSLAFGAESAAGDPAGDLLFDPEGRERLPERRGSFGDGGGPMTAALAMLGQGAAAR